MLNPQTIVDRAGLDVQGDQNILLCSMHAVSEAGYVVIAAPLETSRSAPWGRWLPAGYVVIAAPLETSRSASTRAGRAYAATAQRRAKLDHRERIFKLSLGSYCVSPNFCRETLSTDKIVTVYPFSSLPKKPLMRTTL